MPDVETTCRVCGDAFDTKRGLNTHLTRSKHRAEHNRKSKAAAAVRAFAAAKPYECTFPGCGRRFKTEHGREVHGGLMGHKRITDHVEAGDGGRAEPTHPAYRPQPAEPALAASVTDGTGVVEDMMGPGRRVNHPAVAGLARIKFPAEARPR